MASIEVGLQEQECGICCRTPNDPCSLPCTHMFCYTCLASDGEDSYRESWKISDYHADILKCPKCRAEFVLPPGGLTDMAKNVTRKLENFERNSVDMIDVKPDNMLSPEPLKTYNMLILGATGVGKSTWINAFGNYAVFDSLSEAATKPYCPIPVKFDMYNEQYEKITIRLGESDPVNEDTDSVVGQSATQHPVGYLFTLDGIQLRIIDTPGVCDTRGADRDAVNFENILRYLSAIDELHCICILLKPNDTRLDVAFRFCIIELLAHLHCSAVDNIVFCFTHARETFYRPGETVSLLGELLGKFETGNGIRIPLQKENMFCFDSEAFRFLCAMKNAMQFQEDQHEAFSRSWDVSVIETKRLLKRMVHIKPHCTADTVSLNTAKRLVEKLIKPMADLVHDIERNLLSASELKKKLDSTKMLEESPENHVKRTFVKREIKSLPHPHTVCMLCSIPKKNKDGEPQTEQIYATKQICCSNCSIQSKNPGEVPDRSLLRCSAMYGKEFLHRKWAQLKELLDLQLKCFKCGCNWDCHIRMLYDYELIEVHKTDEETQKLLDEGEVDPDRIKEQAKKGINAAIDKLKDEQTFITSTSAKLLSFVKQNSILSHDRNDDNNYFEEYVDMQIHIAQKMERGNERKRQVEILEKLKKLHRQQMLSIKEAHDDHKMTYEDVFQLQAKLFALPNYGDYLKDALAAINVANTQMLRANEKNLNIVSSGNAQESATWFLSILSGKCSI